MWFTRTLRLRSVIASPPASSGHLPAASACAAAVLHHFLQVMLIFGRRLDQTRFRQ